MPRFLFLMLALVFAFCTQEGRASSGDEICDARNQGALGTCASFAAVDLLEYEIEKKWGQKIRLSQPYLIHNAEEEDLGTHGYGGLPLHLAMDLLKTQGTVAREFWPYEDYLKTVQGSPRVGPKYTDYNLLVDVPRVAQEADKYCFSEVKSNTSEELKVLDFVRKYAKNYHVAVSVPCSPELENWKNGKYVIDEHSIRLGEARRHAVAIYEYNQQKDVFIFKNSWGCGWGAGGYGNFTSDFIEKYASEAWVGMGAVQKKPPAPTPAPVYSPVGSSYGRGLASHPALYMPDRTLSHLR